jgi:hypothetical protein
MRRSARDLAVRELVGICVVLIGVARRPNHHR